jgi:hypothetical protein
MSTKRVPFHLGAVVLACLPLTIGDAGPVAAQGRGSLEIDVRLSEAGKRMIGETEKNMVDVLGTVTIHLSQAAVSDVVLVIAHVSGGRVIARGESAPFRIDAEAAAAPDGVLLGRFLDKEGIRSVAPLRPAEFMVTGHSLAARQVGAVEAVADPGPAFPTEGWQEVIVTVVPADQATRRRARVRPLAFKTAETGR